MMLLHLNLPTRTINGSSRIIGHIRITMVIRMIDKIEMERNKKSEK